MSPAARMDTDPLFTLTLAGLARCAEGRLVGEDRAVDGISTDSRSLRAGQALEAVEHGAQQLVQAGERQVGLRLQANRLEHGHVLAGGRGMPRTGPAPASRTCPHRSWHCGS